MTTPGKIVVTILNFNGRKHLERLLPSVLEQTYADFEVVVVSFVRVAGVLLTFAYLIVPAVCGTMLAQEWIKRLAIGWGVATVASLLGLWASYQMDLPTGAAIVVASGLLLVIVGGFGAMRRR